MTLPNHYDVIIVGGRPAGSTLAARLGQSGLRVLLLERAAFPAAHPVSSPVIYASAMRLLDEIGASEADYAKGTPRIQRWVNEFYDQFQTQIAVPDIFGRNYGYAIDRARFDFALWQIAAHHTTVTVRQPFTVTDLLWEGERVVGVTGRSPNSPLELFRADCVVGADGRFSLVAHKARAAVYDQRIDLPTTVYYASWQNVEPYDSQGAVVHFCKPRYGYFFFMFDSADGVVNVAVEGRADLFALGTEQANAFYLDLIRRHPLVWRRLAQATQTTPVRGLRKIGNFYRKANGPGWVLVGDALHQKDSIDGQGIYDALFSAKALSQAICDWQGGRQTWEVAMARYESVVRAETHPMYIETLNQVKLTVYAQGPLWLDRILYRWLGADPDLNNCYALLTVRGVSPARWLPGAVLARAAVRGAVMNIACLIKRQPHPATLALKNRLTPR